MIVTLIPNYIKREKITLQKLTIEIESPKPINSMYEITSQKQTIEIESPKLVNSASEAYAFKREI